MEKLAEGVFYHCSVPKKNTVDSGYRGMFYRGKSGYRGQFAADGIFYLIKAGQIEEKRAFWQI